MTSAHQPRRLDGKTAVVTGGASGIGRSTCLALSDAGANVVVVDLHPERVEDVVDELSGSPAAALGLALDVRQEADMARMADATVDRFGRIDVLVTCAAILRGPGGSPRPLVDVEADEWRTVIDTNLTGMFLSNRAVLPAMIAQRKGDIVNVSSTSGREGRAHDAPYCASKFGVVGMSESLAAEVRNRNIRVQILLPDATDTPLWDQNLPVPKPAEAMPPERIAETILFLVTLPDDTIIPSMSVVPFGRRQRLRRRAAGEVAAASE